MGKVVIGQWIKGIDGYRIFKAIYAAGSHPGFASQSSLGLPAIASFAQNGPATQQPWGVMGKRDEKTAIPWHPIEIECIYCSIFNNRHVL